MIQKESAEIGPNAYHPSWGELIRYHFIPQIKGTVKNPVKSHPGKIISGLGTTALGLLAVDAAYEFAGNPAAQVETVSDIASRLGLDLINSNLAPDTAYAGNLEQSPIVAPIGGKGFTLGSEVSGVTTSWREGSGQIGYNLYVLSERGLSILPQGRMLDRISAVYTTESTVEPRACYMLVAQGIDGPLGNSDILCAIRYFRSAIGAPRDFTISLNQSNIATLQWSAPSEGGQDGYLILPIGKDLIVLPGNATAVTFDTRGQLTCSIAGSFRNQELIGNTDILCALPGYSNIPDVLPPTPTRTLTPTPTRTQTPTATQTSTPTRQPTETLHPFYSQTLSAEGITIKANSRVEPRALTAASNLVLSMTEYRPDIRSRLVTARSSIAIIKQGESILSMPGINLTECPYSCELVRGFSAGNTSYVGEENLLQRPEDPYTSAGIKILPYEFGGQIEWYGISNTEKAQWQSIFNRLSSQPGFPGNWADLVYYPPLIIHRTEFFGELSRLWENRKASQIQLKDSETYSYFLSIYGPR